MLMINNYATNIIETVMVVVLYENELFLINLMIPTDEGMPNMVYNSASAIIENVVSDIK